MCTSLKRKHMLFPMRHHGRHCKHFLHFSICSWHPLTWLLEACLRLLLLFEGTAVYIIPYCLTRFTLGLSPLWCFTAGRTGVNLQGPKIKLSFQLKADICSLSLTIKVKGRLSCAFCSPSSKRLVENSFCSSGLFTAAWANGLSNGHNQQ